MTFLPEVIHWTVLKVRPLLRRRGAPKSLDDIDRFATAVLRIAHPQLVFLRCLELSTPETLMEVLRVPEEEIATLEKEDPPLAKALLAKRPPTGWVRRPGAEIPPVFVRAALRLLPVELEKITVTSAKLKPMDFLVESALDSSKWFMEPMELRRLFIERLPCADGQNDHNRSVL